MMNQLGSVVAFPRDGYHAFDEEEPVVSEYDSRPPKQNGVEIRPAGLAKRCGETSVLSNLAPTI